MVQKESAQSRINARTDRIVHPSGPSCGRKQEHCTSKPGQPSTTVQGRKSPEEQSQTSTSRTNTWQEAISKCSAPNRNPSYTHYPKECVGGHNIVKFTGKTVEQCKEICSAMSNCDAFEFGVAYGGAGGYQAGDCQPQSSANRDGCDGSYHNLDLYVKY